MANEFDVVIVGCGLVGGSLALALPPSLSIAVIDAESPMQQQPGYLALNIHSCRILQNFGVWNSIVSHETPGAVTPIKQIDISEWHQPTKQLLLQADDIGTPALGYVTSTTAIRETLLARIQSQNNITLYCPERAKDIQWPDEGMENIVVKLSQQDRSPIKAKLVIIADGGRSPLRQQLGFQPHEKNLGHHIVITKLKTQKPHQNLAYERFTTNGPIALLPVGQDEYILVWTMNSSKVNEFIEQSEGSLMASLQAAYGLKEIKTWHETGTRKSYPIACSIVKNPIKTRLVLMGNAAHTVHPVGAQGFNLSLKDALTLSHYIHQAVENGQDIGSERLLKSYWQARQEDTDFVAYFTQFLLHIFSYDGSIFAKARALGMSWMNQSSFIKETILKKTTGTSSSLAQKSPLHPPLQRGESTCNDLKYSAAARTRERIPVACVNNDLSAEIPPFVKGGAGGIFHSINPTTSSFSAIALSAAHSPARSIHVIALPF